MNLLTVIGAMTVGVLTSVVLYLLMELVLEARRRYHNRPGGPK